MVQTKPMNSKRISPFWSVMHAFMMLMMLMDQMGLSKAVPIILVKSSKNKCTTVTAPATTVLLVKYTAYGT